MLMSIRFLIFGKMLQCFVFFSGRFGYLSIRFTLCPGFRQSSTCRTAGGAKLISRPACGIIGFCRMIRSYDCPQPAEPPTARSSPAALPVVLSGKSFFLFLFKKKKGSGAAPCSSDTDVGWYQNSMPFPARRMCSRHPVQYWYNKQRMPGSCHEA